MLKVEFQVGMMALADGVGRGGGHKGESWMTQEDDLVAGLSN